MACPVAKSSCDTLANSSDRGLRVRYSLTPAGRGLVTALQCAVLRQGQVLETTDQGKLGRASFVSMMRSAHFGQLHHFSKFCRLYTSRNRCVLGSVPNSVEKLIAPTQILRLAKLAVAFSLTCMVRGVYAKDSSAASANVMARQWPLEYQLQAELNVARTTRTEHGVGVGGGGIGGGTRTTELPGKALGWISGSGN